MINHISKDEKRDRLKSAIITLLVSLAVLLVIYFYRFTREHTPQQVVTTMLINFGDEKNGSGTEEPKTQESTSAPQAVEQPQTPPPAPQKIVPSKEKIITGKAKTAVPKVEKVEKKTPQQPSKTPNKTTEKTVKKPTESKKSTEKTVASQKSSSKNTQKNTGDANGQQAISNLIKGRGSKSGSQGNSNAQGNAGDPLGDKGNGDSKVGVDRKLIGFIPGTMGRGGAQPAHQCTASGSISIAYVVDQAGNVVSARRSSGISDPCVVATTVAWVKKYVKAERAATSSTGVYKIVF
ncbi:ferric siderophore ABC transporter substrate-binding protein [Riemerella columbina]|uniref:ferric siderophore ABC transporter substrate-binding protein n=1 Tax=Riemerella columbina TaxID=103810 RepID=UPI00266F776C|nr:ferric siderophore ABC transporter substrate-binding protein [Riemerella columbina]WKS96081.1 ferric siderophore ABC transporter substrate-binding protein [Riemerella columbina]